jgi:hypothetical protein
VTVDREDNRLWKLIEKIGFGTRSLRSGNASAEGGGFREAPLITIRQIVSDSAKAPGIWKGLSGPGTSVDR